MIFRQKYTIIKYFLLLQHELPRIAERQGVFALLRGHDKHRIVL